MSLKDLVVDDAANAVSGAVDVGHFLRSRQTMFASFYAKPGRHYKATCAARGRPIPPDIPPPDAVVLNYDHPSLESGKSKKSRPLVLECFNCQAVDNSSAHRTDQFAQTRSSKPHLIVRRGQLFTLKMSFNRPYDPAIDDVSFTFQFAGGEVAGVSSGSRITVRLSQGIKPHNWSAGLVSADRKEKAITAKLLSPPNGVVGQATLIIETFLINSQQSDVDGMSPNGSSTSTNTTSRRTADQDDDGKRGDEEEDEEEEENEENEEKDRGEDEGEEEEESRKKRLIVRYVHPQPVFFLFNPWNKDDEVYVANDDMRDCYVKEDFGSLYIGTNHQMTARPWHYGQYEEGVLECCQCLLDMARIRTASRYSAMNIVRAITNVICTGDDQGLMVGDWSGHVAPSGAGVPPTQWVSSASIIAKFMERKEPVKYGQCWVFSALATTICRALGIPTRCVTNFASAHDCDGGNSINIHWNRDGEPIEEWSTNTVWCFHVWNEAYMCRPDINAGLAASWQVFDVTPQLTTDGIHNAGPCPIKSVKCGDIAQRYDCQLIFFDIYSDVIHWTLQEDGSWRSIMEKNRTGRRLVTEGWQLKTARASSSSLSTSSSTADGEHGNSQIASSFLDVTDQYKYPEGSEEERASLQRSSVPYIQPAIYDMGEGDLKFELVKTEPIRLGDEFSIVINVQNTCRFERTVSMSLTLVACHYTGLTKTRLKRDTFDFNLCSLRSRQVVMRLPAEDYSYVAGEFATFRVYMHATVEETDQLVSTFYDVHLIPPELTIKVPKNAELVTGVPFQCTVELVSPMIVALQNCKWMVDAPGMLQHAKLIDQAEVEPFGTATVKLTLTPTRPGKHRLLASFHSNELTGVIGTLEVDIGLPGSASSKDCRSSSSQGSRNSRHSAKS